MSNTAKVRTDDEYKFNELMYFSNKSAAETFRNEAKMKHGDMSEQEYFDLRMKAFNEWQKRTHIEEVNGKRIIVNGSVNKLLTIDEMIQFNNGQKIRATWNISVDMEYAHNYRDVDPIVFEKPMPRYQYEHIRNLLNRVEDTDHINAVLTDIMKARNDHHARMVTATNNRLYALGKEMPEVLKKYGIKGELEMPLAQLEGYLSATGKWNDFDPVKVSYALHIIDQSIPQVNYGLNNPNTGNKCHTFSIQSDYIFVKVGYCTPEHLERLKEWFEKKKHTIQSESKADSVRYEQNDYRVDENGPITGHDFTFVMWWD
jgi:hypothetical protein